VSAAALETVGLGKRYLRRWALRDCSLRIPRGHVVGLVGPNGAGKSTLLNLAAGLLSPSAGSIKVLGERPARDATQLARVGFVPQDAVELSAVAAPVCAPTTTLSCRDPCDRRRQCVCPRTPVR